MKDKVLVFGYSENSDRYSHKAFNLLKDFDYNPIPFNPRSDDIKKIADDFHTLTLYVGAVISDKFTQEIMDLKFKRIIFNPGAENDKLEKLLKQKGVEVVHGCTLVMLKTDQF